MNKQNKPFRLLPFLMAVVMCLMMPIGAFAAEEAVDDISVEDMVLPDPPDEEADRTIYPTFFAAYDYNSIPEEMMDNAILRALAYTGYDVQYQKDNRMLYDLNYIGYNVLLNTPDVLSGIPYSSDGSGSGLETVNDSSTPTGKAPNIARFRDVTGLDCADFCAYFLCNYLPNIEGVDTSIFTEYRASLGYRQDDMRFWQAACEDMAAKGLLDEYKLTESDANNNTAAYQEAFANAVPGDLIRLGTASRPWVHYAIYAGYFNGDHYIIHVGNSRGPEITLVKYMNDPASSKRSVPLAIYHFYWNDTLQDGIIQVNKTDTNGAPLRGAQFTATNTETGDKYLIGPTNSSGYAMADKIPFGTYNVVETAFPSGYQSNGTTSWTVTLNRDTPDATVTVNAVNKLITGNLQIIKRTNTGKNLGGWKVGVYTDQSCTRHITGSPFTTDSNGVINVQNLAPGTYYCLEYGVIDSYWVCDSGAKMVTVTGNQTATLTISNTHYGDLRVQKIAVNGSSQGWSFQIFNSSKQLVTTITTKANGYATSPMLEPGTYYVCEVKDLTSNYWTYDPAYEKKVEVVAGTQAQISFTNTHCGKIKIVKLMNTDGTMGGWKFKVTDSTGAEIPGSPFTTLSSGIFLTGKLAPGQYTVEELIPEGSLYYCKSQNPQTITVTAGADTTVNFVNALRPGCISIKKTDAQGNPLADAEFILEWSADGETWQSVAQTSHPDVVKGCSAEPAVQTSTEEGTLQWSNLYPGIYYRVTETKAPDGYTLLARAVFEGELPEDDLSVKLQVINTRVFTLPPTGSGSPIVLAVSITVCLFGCIGALLLLKKKEA